MAIIHILRTAFVLVFVSLFAVFVALPLMLYAAIRRSPVLLYRVSIMGVRASIWLSGIRVHVEGLDNIPSGVCVFVANHVSYVDPPILVAAIPRQIAVLAKKEIFRLPILGPAMRQAYFIPVDRSNKEAAAEAIMEAAQNLQNGVSYLAYPEGTRSADGRLRAFKKGSFVMAIQAGVPVVPVAVIGAQRLMRKGEWFVRPGETTVRFQPPVNSANYTMAERAQLLGIVHQRIAEGLPPEQRPLASARVRP